MQWCHYFELVAMALSMSFCHWLAMSALCDVGHTLYLNEIFAVIDINILGVVRRPTITNMT
jgi:hypothetical protein